MRTVERVPLEQRWSVHTLEWVRAVSWNGGKEDVDADGDVFGVRRQARPLEDADSGDFKNCTQGALTKPDIEKFDFTDQCRSVFGGFPWFSSSAPCRTLLEKDGKTCGR